MAQFKDMLAYYRKKDNLTQRDLAKRLGLSASTIGMYESGQRFPEREIEEAIADYFNISLNTLRGIDDEIPAMAEGVGELINLYNAATPEQRKAVISLLRSFVS